VKLIELLDEAKARAVQIFKDRLKEEERVQINLENLEESADILGLSSIKYYELRQNRTQNYVFSFDKILDPKGNTGVYLIYQYVRICSIIRKGGYEGDKLHDLIASEQFKITHPTEKELALSLLKVPEQIELALQDLQINRITDQLYDISCKMSEFYTQVHVLGNEEEKSRILLLEASRRVMKTCFDMLGMNTLERI
jgi:arginyl-tRNA synthetase